VTFALDVLADVVFVGALLAISFVDVKRRIVPNRIVLPAAAVVLVVRTAAHPSFVWLAAGIGAALFLLAAAVARPGGMGMGDVKLAGVLGLCLGSSVAPALLIALLSGVALGVGLIVREGAAKGRKRAVPFGPFLALGALVAVFAGPHIVDLYVNHFVH
jgi:leader peptidase (prepilin peptidase) / N-methyltransferase